MQDKKIEPQKEHKKEDKAQAAMEFLLTYGWAILIVLVVIAALAYFGVLNPAKLLPGRCMFQVGVDCEDYVASSNPFISGITDQSGVSRDLQPLSFNLINKLGKIVYVTEIRIVGDTKDYMCMEFKQECDPGTDWLENSIQGNSFAMTIFPGKMCTSIKNLCEQGYSFSLGSNTLTMKIPGCTDPKKALQWKVGDKLISSIENVIQINGQPLPPTAYASFATLYCFNMPKKGERMKAQIIVTYHEGDPAFTKQAYGELATTVE